MSDRRVLGEDMADCIEKAGLLDPCVNSSSSGVATLLLGRVFLGNWLQLGTCSESIGRGLRSKAGLLCKDVEIVSTLCRENTDDDMLLSVELWSRLRCGVSLRDGVTGRGSLEPDPRDRKVYLAMFVKLGDRDVGNPVDPLGVMSFGGRGDTACLWSGDAFCSSGRR
jgi:hypothetical protein